MGIDEFNNIVRKVWKSSDGTRLLAVTGIVEPGEYDIEKTENDDESITLEMTKRD